VENPTDEDWKDVRMALVSGRPISFQMDLYTPLYVPRPVVVPELFQSLRPVAYSGSIDGKSAGGSGVAAGAGLPVPLRSTRPEDGGLYLGTQHTFFKQSNAEKSHLLANRGFQPGMDLGRSVSSAATAAKLGDYFQYAIDKPVSLPRQKSALLPIVTKEVEAA